MPRKKKCPNPICEFQYSKSTRQCPLCKAIISIEVDDNFEKKDEKIKVVKENNGETVHLSGGIYSVRYWQLNRCFVKLETDDPAINFCTKKECSDLRRLAVRNEQNLMCQHVKQVKADIEANIVNER